MTIYRERLSPNLWLLIAGLLFIPAVLLALTPISFALAVPVSLAFYASFVWFLFATSPVVIVTDSALSAGRAVISRNFIGKATVLDADETRRKLTTSADARAHLTIRSWIPRSVQVEITDVADNTPYWLITSRNPAQLAEALNG